MCFNERHSSGHTKITELRKDCPVTCTDIYTVDTADQLLVLENNTQTLYFAKYKNQELCDILMIFRLKWIT